MACHFLQCRRMSYNLNAVKKQKIYIILYGQAIPSAFTDFLDWHQHSDFLSKHILYTVLISEFIRLSQQFVLLGCPVFRTCVCKA